MEKKKKILVVEDDPAIAEGLKALLKSEGYEVLTSQDGKSGLEKVRSIEPNLVLLDVNLPKMGGFEVCRELRAGGFINPIIMLTSRSEQTDKVVGLEAGADDYVTKPFSTHEIIARIRANLRRVQRFASDTSPAMARADKSDQYQRRLLSIMFTDVKDYSKKMNEDEDAAMKLLHVHNAIVTRIVARYGGRVVEIIGDAFLVSFESAVKAVQCAVEIQQEFRGYRQHTTRKEHIHIRIGIHVGEVIEVGGKLRGETINLAARIQQLAVPDFVYISGSVFDIINNKIDVRVKDIGEQKVKNIKQLIKVYQVRL